MNYNTTKNAMQAFFIKISIFILRLNIPLENKKKAKKEFLTKAGFYVIINDRFYLEEDICAERSFQRYSGDKNECNKCRTYIKTIWGQNGYG